MGTATDYDIASLRREIERLEERLTRAERTVSKLDLTVWTIKTSAICAAFVIAEIVVLALVL